MADVGLESELVLDITQALTRVDEIGAALAKATDSVPVTLNVDDIAAQLSAAVAGASPVAQVDTSEIAAAVDTAVADASPVVSVDPDVTAIDPAIEGAIADVSSLVKVDADTTNLGSDIETAVDAIAPPPIDVPVSFDPPTAETAAFGSALHEAETESLGLEQATSALGVAAGVAVGETGALTDGLHDLGTGGAVAAGFVAALSAATTEFAQAGFDAVGAEFRLNQSLGSLAGTIDSIQVGNLNTDLGSLANSLGSTKASVENAAATLVNLGVAAGASRVDAEKTAETFIGLASRAVALNPALGSVEDVASRLSTALARGGRFAQQYGIALTTAEISAEALRETGKSSTADLTVYEKAVAGATLATQKYGDTLSQTIGEGSQNPILQLRSLKARFQEILETAGKPLVSPILNLLGDIEPVAAGVATQIGALVAQLLPLVDEVLPKVGPLLTGVVDVFDAGLPIIEAFANIVGAIPNPVLELAAAFFTMRAALTAISGLSAVTRSLDLIGTGMAAVRTETISSSEAIAPYVVLSDEAAASNTAMSMSADGAAVSFGAQAVGAESATVADESLVAANEAVDVSLGPLGIAIVAVSAVLAVFSLSGGQASQASTDLQNSLKELGSAFNDVSNSGSGALDEFTKKLNETNAAITASFGSGADIGISVPFRDALSKMGLTVDQFNALLAEGKPAVDAYLGSIDDGTNEARVARSALSDLAGSTLDQAKASLAGKAAQSDANAALVASAEQTTKNADGSVNYVAALDKVNGSLKTQADGEKTKADAQAKAAQAEADAAANAQALAAAYDKLAEKSPKVASAVDAITKAGGFVAAAAAGQNGALGDLALTLDKASLSEGDFAAVAQHLGVSVDSLKGFTKDAASAFDALNTAADNALPKVEDVASSGFQTIAEKAKGAQDAIDRAQIGVEQANTRLATAQQSAATATAAHATAAAGEVKQATIDVADANQRLVDAQTAAANALDPAKLLAGLHETLDAVTSFNKNLTDLVGAGLDHVAKLALEKGPEFTQQLVDAINNDPSHNFGTALEQQLTDTSAATAAASANIKSTVIPAIVEATGGISAAVAKNFAVDPTTAGDNLAGSVDAAVAAADPALAQSAAAAGGAFSASFSASTDLNPTSAIQAAADAAFAQTAPTSPAPSAAKALGDAVTSAFSTSVGQVGNVAVSAFTTVGLGITLAKIGLIPVAHDAGVEIGHSLGQGIAQGMNETQAVVDAAAAAVVAQGAQAARDQAKAKSPSRLFAEIGKQLSAGLAAGITESIPDVVAAQEKTIAAVAGVPVQTARVAPVSVSTPRVGFAAVAATDPSLPLGESNTFHITTSDPFIAAQEVVRKQRAKTTTFAKR